MIPVTEGSVWRLQQRIGRTATPAQIAEASRLINGDRQADYGPPEVNFARIAWGWSNVLTHAVEPAEVALCMAELKLARLQHTPDHHDSIVDALGYLAIAEHLRKAGNKA